jgi:hypothetical protein
LGYIYLVQQPGFAAACSSQHAPEAQQAASQTQGPPASQAQPSSTQAQSAHAQALPQQQPDCWLVENAGTAKAASRIANEAMKDFNISRLLKLQ